MEPRLTLITLGVDNLDRSRRFYAALGFRESSASNEHVAFLPAGGVVIALWDRASLAEDAHVPAEGGGFRGFALAHNVRTTAEVDEVLAHAAACGGRIAKPAQTVFWGGYCGYFQDPDGFLWEVAHNPGMPLDADGRLQVPPPAA